MAWSAWKLAVFAIAVLAGLAWVASNDGEHATLVRHFLSNLLRRFF